MGLDPRRRAGLLGAKLGALVADRWGVAGEPTAGETSDFGRGAALRWGERAWVLLDDHPERGLGPALAWGAKHGATELHVLVDGPGGSLARRALAFSPAPTVWEVDGRLLVRAEPAPFPAAVQPTPEALAAAQPLYDHGLDVVHDHGEITGEILGLEVARVVAHGDGPRLEVGVGRHDREAFAMMRAGVAPADALVEVIATVERHRRPGAARHPLNQLATERWMRARLVADPSMIGASRLSRFEIPGPRAGLGDPFPSVAAGRLPGGGPVVAVCSSGVDLDLVPTAADAREAFDAGALLVIVVPERDAVEATRALAAMLSDPARIVTVGGDWRG